MTSKRYHYERLSRSLSTCRLSTSARRFAFRRCHWVSLAAFGSLVFPFDNHTSRRSYVNPPSSFSHPDKHKLYASGLPNNPMPPKSSSMQTQEFGNSNLEEVAGDHLIQRRDQRPMTGKHTVSPVSRVGSYKGPPPADGNMYTFPTGRALRMVRRGRWHCHLRDASGESVEEFVARCRHSLSIATATTEGPGKAVPTDLFRLSLLPDIDTSALLNTDGACIDILGDEETDDADGGNRSDSDPSPAGSCGSTKKEGVQTMSTSAGMVEEASRFIAYHCHHVLVGFKSNRKTWFNRDKRQKRPEQAKCEKLRPGSTFSGLLHPYSAAELGMLMDYVFQASVLLHLTGLYEVGEKYLEPLLDVCLSVSIFLSQAHNYSRHKQAQRSNRESRGTAHDVLLDSSLRPHWVSLRWAVVHYCEAVRLWELLDHTAPLFNVDRTREPFGRLLQAHIGLIMQMLNPQSLPREDWNCFTLLRAGSESQKRSMAIPRWFGEFVNSNRSALDAEDALSGTSSSQFCFFAQQRRLQLLPMLWLTMLGAHIQRDEVAPKPEKVHTSGGCGSLMDSFGEMRLYSDEQEMEGPTKEVTWRAAHHSLLHLIPLFSREARADASLWALIQLFYTGSDRPRSGRVELAALLSSLERHGMITEFVPFSSTPFILDDPSGASRVRFLLQRWLRSFSCGSTATLLEVSPGISEPTVTTLTGMYMAFTKLPLCVLPLTLDTVQDTHASMSRPQLTTVTSSAAAGFDGLHFLTILLYRILIQWRPSCAKAAPRSAGFLMLSEKFRKIFKDVSLAANNKGTGNAALSKRHQIRAECCAELVLMLKAVHRLHGLYHCVMQMGNQKPHQGQDQSQGRSNGAAKEGACSTAGTFALVIEAATRGLTMQLGEVVFPRYLEALQESGELRLSVMERDLLEILHTMFTNILVKGIAEDAHGADVDAALQGRPGAIPSAYYEGIEALFQGSIS